MSTQIDGFNIIQPLKKVYGDQDISKTVFWNDPDYIKLREALKILGYDTCLISVLHSWHRQKHMDFIYSTMSKDDEREIIVIHANNKITASARPHSKYRYHTFELNKPANQIAEDMKYFFGEGSQDWG